MKILLAVITLLVVVAAAFALFAAALWWLVPLAFPLLPFGYPQALALTGIVALILLASTKN